MGDYLVCLTVTDTCGTVQFCDSLSVLATEIIENHIGRIILFPNPASEYILITGYTGSGGQVVLYNALGEVVLSQRIESANTQVQLSKLNSGVYMIFIFDDDKMLWNKLLLKL